MEIDYIADVLLFLFEGYLIMHRIKFYGLFNENVKCKRGDAISTHAINELYNIYVLNF